MLRSGLRIPVWLITLACLTAAATAAPPSLRHTERFADAAVTIDRVDGYDVVRIPGAQRTFAIGAPELPLVVVRFALPDGYEAVDVIATAGSQRTLATGLTVRPVQPQVPLSRLGDAKWRDPDPAIYSSRSPYPRSAAALLDSGIMSGTRIATVAVYPVQYLPADGTLLLNEDIDLEVRLAPANERPRDRRTLSEHSAREISDRLGRLVVNQDALRVWSKTTRTDPVDYLLVTDSAYVSIFQPLVDWKTTKGLSSEIVTTAWIYSNYSGVDNQEKIRNCIIDYYENRGTTWVLLGGDTNVVPARIVFAMDTGGSAHEDEIRCDLYYADVDGTWNADGDGRWGEITQDNIDMYADLYVGRAPVQNSSEATLFVDKLLTYEGAPGAEPLPTDFQTEMLFMAEVLWSDPWTDHAICKNMIDDDAVPEQFDPITKLYQTNGLLTKSNAIGAMNAGQNIVNHNGHAYWNVMSIGSSSLYRSDLDNLTNDPRYGGVFYTIGCWAAAIDYDCIAEHWVNSQGGGVAFIGNSRYGWGSPGSPGYGTSDVLDRMFFHKLFNEGLERVGVAHAAHKDEYVAQARSDGYMRYCVYQLNLLGDPEMRIWVGDLMDPVVGHDDPIPLGEHPYLVTVARDGAPVGDAQILLSNGEFSISATTGPDGVATLTPDPTATGSATLMVTGQGILPYSATVAIADVPADTDAPAGVSGLRLADPFDLGGVIELDWTAYAPPPDFAFYEVYREESPFDDVSGFTPIATGFVDPDTKTWTDYAADPGALYYYAVAVTDLASNSETIVEAEGPIAGSVNSQILLWDADDGDRPFDGVNDDYSTMTGTEIPWVEALESIGELYTLSNTLPSDLSPFDLVIYLGGVVNFGVPEGNVPMSDDEATALTAFVDEGGSLYIEEPNFATTYYLNGTQATIDLWDRLHATYGAAAPKAVGNVETLTGQSGAISEGMTFAYDYQSDCDQYVRIIGPDGEPGTSLVWSDEDSDERGALYVDPATGSRRYVVPVLLGGVTNGSHPSTRLEYVTRILDDLGLIGSTGVEDPIPGPASRLAQNAPNPFNPVTTISYSVGRGGARVKLTVFDVTGRRVVDLVDGISEAGEQRARWDGRNAAGQRVSSGVYFYRLTVDDWSATRRMILLK